MGTEVSTLREQLKRLGLHTMADIVEHEADIAAKSGSSFSGFLARLAEQELAAKADRSIRERIRKARFPMLRTLESFDFSYQPTLPAAQVRELANLGFVDRAESVIFVGASGTGKTHLAIALALKACEARRRVLFVSAVQLVEQLAAAAVSNQLGPLLATLTRVDLLVCDELGYLPITDSRQANLFFQLMSRRYEKGATIITTNRPFEQWDKTFGDATIAAAILDRLLHHAHIFPIQGPSYRLKDRMPLGEGVSA
jgi:DNA replication protein DnaC